MRVILSEGQSIMHKEYSILLKLSPKKLTRLISTLVSLHHNNKELLALDCKWQSSRLRILLEEDTGLNGDLSFDRGLQYSTALEKWILGSS